MAPRKKKMTEDTPPSETKMDLTMKFEYQFLTSKASKAQDIENLNSLGKEGWELVQTLKEKSDRWYVLKREL